MKEPLRMPFESAEPNSTGPRLIHETDGNDRRTVPSFCTTLREARIKSGYSVADAAHALRIQEHYLLALEEGRFDEIPGTTYAIGFLRSYAGFLVLDPDEFVDAFKREQGLDTGEQQLAFPSPSDSSPKPKFWLVLLVLVLAGLAYGGWQYQSTGGQVATDLVADVSTRLVEAVGMGEGGAPQGQAAVAPDAQSVAAEAAAAEAPTPAEPVQATLGESRQAEAAEAAPVSTAGAQDEVGQEALGEAAAVEGPPADRAPHQPPPAEVDTVADAAPTPAPAAPSEEAATLQPVEAAALAPVQQAEAADQPPALSAPLELAAATVGGTAGTGDEAAESGSARPGESNDAAAVQAPPVEPTVEAPPEEPAPAAAPDNTEATLSSDTGYVPKVYGESNLEPRVVITATSDSWVQVQGPDRELLLTRILHEGDSYRVPDRPDLVMVTGNAGGLEIRVDDALAPPLGPLGVVIRNIALDPDRLAAGTATGR